LLPLNLSAFQKLLAFASSLGSHREVIPCEVEVFLWLPLARFSVQRIQHQD
jgi:hypothetical protein